MISNNSPQIGYPSSIPYFKKVKAAVVEYLKASLGPQRERINHRQMSWPMATPDLIAPPGGHFSDRPMMPWYVTVISLNLIAYSSHFWALGLIMVLLSVTICDFLCTWYMHAKTICIFKLFSFMYLGVFTCIYIYLYTVCVPHFPSPEKGIGSPETGIRVVSFPVWVLGAEPESWKSNKHL